MDRYLKSLEHKWEKDRRSVALRCSAILSRTNSGKSCDRHPGHVETPLRSPSWDRTSRKNSFEKPELN